MAARKQVLDQVEALPEQTCVNHPDRVAVWSTTSDGAHQEMHFCEQCIPEHWR